MVAALAQTMMFFGSEIPAAWPLQEIAAEGGNIADLRTCGAAHCVSQGRIALTNQGVARQGGKRNHRSEV